MSDPHTYMTYAATAVPLRTHADAARQQAADNDVGRHEGDEAWTISLRGLVDAGVVKRLHAQVADALTGYDRVVIDLRHVSVLGTPALALLCSALRSLHRPGSTLVISSAPPPACEAIEACELSGVELTP